MASKPKSAREQLGGKRQSAGKGISDKEVREVEELSTPRTPVIFEIVRRHGEEELERPAVSLWWSGLAAGLSMSFSLLAQAILQSHLPDTPWRPLVVSFGYCVGFLMVVLSRQQLFTESTITAVIPITANLTLRNLGRMGRLWVIVLAANLTGTLFAALFCTYTPVLSPDLLKQMLVISEHLTTLSVVEMFFRAIAAGFLVAALVWLRPGAEGNQFHVITLMSYLIAVGGFTHVIAGSMEAFLLVADGQQGVWFVVGHFMAPTLLGNIVGGTALFTVISYAQVMKEI